MGSVPWAERRTGTAIKQPVISAAAGAAADRRPRRACAGHRKALETCHFDPSAAAAAILGRKGRSVTAKRGVPVKLATYLVTRQAMKSEVNTRSTLRLTFMPFFPAARRLPEGPPDRENGCSKTKSPAHGRGIFDERLDTLIVSPLSRQMQGSDERTTVPTTTAAVA